MSDARPPDDSSRSGPPDDPPTVAACQMAVSDLDVAANLDAVTERVAGLAPEVDVALFPEYALTGFVADERARDSAIRRDGPALTRIEAVAADEETAIVVGFLEIGTRSGDDAEPRLYNALAYVSPEGVQAVYRKRHRWGRETDVVGRGDRLVTVETPIGTAGLVTCYDLNFVEDSVAFTDREVDALLVAGAWPATESENWRLLLRARALDGVRWVVGACRTGRRDLPDAPSTAYAGRSAIVRPDGKVHAALGRESRDLVADLDPDVLADQRETIPVYVDRRRNRDSG